MEASCFGARIAKIMTTYFKKICIYSNAPIIYQEFKPDHLKCTSSVSTSPKRGGQCSYEYVCSGFDNCLIFLAL